MRSTELLRSPEKVLMLMQEAVHECMDARGVDRPRLLREGSLLIIVSSEYTLDPSAPDAEVAVRAELTGLNLFFMEFTFALTAAGGFPVGTARSVWAVMDRDTRKAIPTDGVGLPRLGRPVPARVRLDGVLTEHRTFTPDESFRDHNDHVNNAQYFRMLPLSGRAVTGMAVEYRREVRIGEAVDLAWSDADGELQMRAFCGEKVCFDARVKTVNIPVHKG